MSEKIFTVSQLENLCSVYWANYFSLLLTISPPPPYLLTESLTLVDLRLSDLAGSKLWVCRRLIWTRKEWRIWNENILESDPLPRPRLRPLSSAMMGGNVKGGYLCLITAFWTWKEMKFISYLMTCNSIYLLIAETIKQGSKEALKGGKKRRSDGPECEVGDIRLWKTQ